MHATASAGPRHTGRVGLSLASTGVALLLPGQSFAAPPLSALGSAGAEARTILPLTWGLLALSVVVVATISMLVVVGVARRRQSAAIGGGGTVPVARERSGIAWIVTGVSISAAALIGFMVWTVVTLAAVGNDPAPGTLTVDVTAHRWWWQVQYQGATPSQNFLTANEIHIPVGVDVLVRLHSEDVIHSFWVPALGGKTDVIPGQTNTTVLNADRPGIYRGQCSEFCGQQHSHMAFLVVADDPATFEAWRTAQIAPAAIASGAMSAGEQEFVQNCGACHTARGTPAGGIVGPDLTHLMSRQTIAAGTLANTPGNLAGWIAAPQQIKPGALMPNLDLSGPQLASILAFVGQLQ